MHNDAVALYERFDYPQSLDLQKKYVQLKSNTSEEDEIFLLHIYHDYFTTEYESLKSYQTRNDFSNDYLSKREKFNQLFYEDYLVFGPNLIEKNKYLKVKMEYLKLIGDLYGFLFQLESDLDKKLEFENLQEAYYREAYELSSLDPKHLSKGDLNFIQLAMEYILILHGKYPIKKALAVSKDAVKKADSEQLTNDTKLYMKLLKDMVKNMDFELKVNDKILKLYQNNKRFKSTKVSSGDSHATDQANISH